MRRSWQRVVLAFLVAWTVPVTAQAQTTRDGRLTVTVTDPSGAIVPGASVSVTSLDTPIRITFAAPSPTSGKGVATIEGLLPGRYSVQVQFPGFEVGRLADVRIRSG